jgi:hypothetical protein
MASMRLKISVLSLIRRIETQKAKEIKEHAVAVKQYEKDNAVYQKALEKALATIQKKVAAATVEDLVKNYYRSQVQVDFTAEVEVDRPVNPGEKLDTTRHDNNLAMLRATTQSEIGISVNDDLASYIV